MEFLRVPNAVTPLTEIRVHSQVVMWTVKLRRIHTLLRDSLICPQPSRAGTADVIEVKTLDSCECFGRIVVVFAVARPYFQNRVYPSSVRGAAVLAGFRNKQYSSRFVSISCADRVQELEAETQEELFAVVVNKPWGRLSS